MKALFRKLLHCTLLASAAISLTQCDDDNDGGPQLTGDSFEYALGSVSDPAISGTVTFAERDDNQVVITIDITGTQAGSTHPAHIHMNSAAQGGNIVLDLADVNGADGKSETVVNAFNDGTPLDYEDFMTFDGHVNVHLSASDLGTLIAQGDIGANELTGDKKEYTMIPVADPNVTGKAIFEKRKKGTTLVTIQLTGTQDGANHPSHFHANTIAESGPIIIHLKNVNGTTGMAQTSVDTTNTGEPITYEQLLDLNAYINVHTGATFVAQVDVGQNELTGDHQHYTLNEAGASGATGVATFEKRKNGKAQITLELTGTTAGGDHPAHIHANDAATGGPIVLDLKNVSGTTGKSVTSVNTLKNTNPITYDELVAFDGHINVHASPDDLGTLIVQGDIGANFE